MIDANGVEITELDDVEETDNEFCECSKPKRATSEHVSMGPNGIEYTETEYCEICNLPII